MPKVGQPSKRKTLYHPLCPHCRGTKIDEINNAVCRKCESHIFLVDYPVFEGVLKIVISLGSTLNYNKKKDKWTVVLENTTFEAQHLIDAVTACWNWAHKNEVGCINVEKNRG